MLSLVLLAALNCSWYWTVEMPDGNVLRFEGQTIDEAFRAEDGYTKIIAQYKDLEAGRSCCAPGVKWMFLSSFDHTGDTSNWTRSVH